MAFESQLAAQRNESKERSIIRSAVFMLRVVPRVRGEKKDEVLDLRLPAEVVQKAKLKDHPIDIFFDHESHKVMIAPSLAGVKLTVKESSATQQFIFTRGFTPDFGAGGMVVSEYELVPHGDGQGIVFNYPPLLMVSGRNTIKDGEQPKRGQTYALRLLAEERQRAEQALADAEALRTTSTAPAPPASASKYVPQARVEAPGVRVRRSFTDEDKKEAVRAHYRWMQDGMTFGGACEKIGVAGSVLRNWREQFLKQVEREERRLAQANHGKRGLNGTAAHAQH